ncbi:MAG TPA: PTS sugar transporter subunit IIA, partial [Alkalispirochaeta sp.]|nr:PTS sugar transporter subunit IIA [Alkalispirochaeta sp.]
MAQHLVQTGYCHESFVDAILERERIHPSGLPMPGHKIAIPHTDADHVKRSVILFARLKNPVPFRSMGDPHERLPVQMISMFALHEKKRTGDMLETLITVYQRHEVLDAILNAGDRDEIYELLRDGVRTHGKR